MAQWSWRPERLTAWIGWTALVLSVAVVVIALALVLFSKRNLPTVLLAVFLIAWGVVGFLLAWATEEFLFEDPVVLGLYIIVVAFHYAAMVSFAVVYPNLALTKVKLAMIITFLLLAVAFLVATVTRPWTLADLEVLQGGTLLFGEVSVLVGVCFLGYRWIRARSSAYRMQVLWGLLVFVFWSIQHAFLSLLVYPSAFGGSLLSFGDWPWIIMAASWNAVLAGAVSLTLILSALHRYIKGRHDDSDRVLVLIAPFLIATATLQVHNHALHILLDYLAAALVIYGVLRFNVVDIDLKLKWGVKHSTVGAAFVAAFFVVSEGAKELFAVGAGLGPWLGILAAGGLVFAIAPLQRLGEAVSGRVVPHTGGGDDYLAYRRFQIYRVALEGALQDGVMSPKEASALRNLRLELGLSDEDHQRLEVELQNSLAR